MNRELGLCCNAFVQVGGAALDVDFGLLGQVRDRLACEVVLGYGCNDSSGRVGSLTSRLHLERDWFGSHVSMLLRLVRERIVNLVQGWLEAVLSANDNNFGLVGAGASMQAIKVRHAHKRVFARTRFKHCFVQRTTPERPLLEMSARGSPMGVCTSLITQLNGPAQG